MSGAYDRNQVYLHLWKILVHGTVFLGDFFLNHNQDKLISSIKEDIFFFLIKLAVRVCVRQIVTEPIICHSYHPECSHEDINRKRSHFICKEKGRCFLKISKAQIHTPHPRREE